MTRQADGYLFVLANSDDSTSFDLVRSACEAALEGKSTTLAAAKSLDAKLVTELIGEYRDDKDRTLTVSREGNYPQPGSTGTARSPAATSTATVRAPRVLDDDVAATEGRKDNEVAVERRGYG